MAFRNPIVAGEELQIPGMRSADYVEAASGWRVARTGGVQFADAKFLGDVGTDGQMSADGFQIGPSGLWLPDGTDVGDFLNNLVTNHISQNPWPTIWPGPGKGLVGYYEDTNVGGAITAETGIIAARFHEEKNRAYRVTFGLRVTQTVATDQWFARIRYTRDNTVPTITSAALRIFHIPPIGTGPAQLTESIAYSFIHQTNLEDDCWLALFISRWQGTGTISVTADSSNRCFIAIEDIGPYTVSLVPTNGVGSSYALPTAPPVPAPKTYTTVYNPTWSRTFDGDLTTTWDDSAYCYQGQYDANRQNTRSCVGYDYTKIMADLAGATINSVKLTFKVAHAYYGSGVTAIIGGHNYTTKPATVNMTNIAENAYSRASCVAGSTYTVTLPSSFGTNLKSGTWKGIAFGPGPSTSKTYYGYMYGATQTGKPYLTISYTK